MGQQLGRLLLIKIVTAISPRTTENLCGFRARTFNLSANEVDTTLPDCVNPGGPVQRTVRPGVSQRTFAGSGLFVSGTVAALVMGHVRAGTTFEADVIVPGDGTYSGMWMAANFEFSGEMEDDLAFSASFSAAGPLSFTAEAGAPSNILMPSIAGIAQAGQTLTALPGAWSGAPLLTWQWQVDDEGWEDIAGATGRTHVVAGAHVGKPLRVNVTATNGSGSASASSAATADVLAA